MARKIKWSKESSRDLEDILDYWNNRNKSKNYSRKLYKEIHELVHILALYPHLGVSTNENRLRVKVFRDYKIFYDVHTDFIHILKIWDSRRDPKNLNI